MDLLEHEVLVAFLFGCVRIPADVEYLSLDLPALFIVDVDVVLGQNDGLVVFYEIYLAHVLEQCRDIRCDQVEAFADTGNQRSVLTDCNDLIRLVCSDDSDSVGAAHVFDSLVDSLEKVSVVVDADEVCDDLGVSLRLEGNAVFSLQPLADLLVVLDDAVVHDSD